MATPVDAFLPAQSQSDLQGGGHRTLARRLWLAGQKFGHAAKQRSSIRNWFAKRPRWHTHYTPTSASWISLVERFFANLTDKQIRRGAHRSTAELEAAIASYIDAVNANPKPFVWTKSADDILASVKRFCAATLGAAHRRCTVCYGSPPGEPCFCQTSPRSRSRK
jgi:hypothetical protein